MKLFFMILLSLTTSSTAIPYYAKRGCNYTCGKVSIPYPFGIGANCAVNRWYTVDCNSSTPYLSALNNLEVLGINLENQTVTVNIPIISDCRNPVWKSSQILKVDLDGTPFLFSRYYNKFVVTGCGNAVILDDGSVLTGCSTTCRNDSVSEIISNCVGINCCQTTIPYNLKSYSMNLTGLERQLGGDAVCGSAFLMDENSHVRSLIAGNISHVPVSLLWTLTDRDESIISCCFSKVRLKVDLGNGKSVMSYKCRSYDGYEGNYYIEDGCDSNEECQRCSSYGGSCYYGNVYQEDGLVSKQNWTCIYFRSLVEEKKSLGVILGVSISMGVLFLVAISYVLYKVIKKTKAKRRRKRFFKRNGGLLLKQQEEADPYLFDKTILFTSRELEKATDYFNENRILGRGGQGTVYKGMLMDGRIVAVKKSKVVDESQLEQFINEVVILSQVNHRNVVKLLGCCLETEVPLLVSEFIPNGTLYDRIHNETDDFPISLNMRLQIATEVAGAVAYLHSATSIPIYHRDIKTTNILLDDKHRAKVSDFGTSRFVSMDQTHLTTLVKGTFGYLDPEYFQSSQFTEKSDVYSFGVVLVELLTGEMPISLTRFGENRSLATHFMLAMEEGRVMSIIDAMVIKEGTRDEIFAVANLAMRCLNLNGKNRPTMKEVVAELETIRVAHVPSMVQTNSPQVMQAEELQMMTYGESTSTFMSVDDNIVSIFTMNIDAHEDGDCAEGEALQHVGGTSPNDNIPYEVSAGGVAGEVESTPDLLTNRIAWELGSPSLIRIGVSISMGVLFLVAISYVLYKVIKKTKAKRRRKRFFKRNGGLLLKQQEEADPYLFDKTILFTSRELEKATDYFNENRILGRGGQGTVYKGMLMDGRIVAVKKSKVVDESQLEQFINEVVILSQVNHRNVVKLLGCCLETEVPLLVSEFIPNGTLYDRIHNETDDFPISLNMRLQIATEVAGAVAYLHSATSIPIYHRDIKTTNILLDDKHRAKVSDFGTSRFVSMDQTHLTTLVKGTFGYLDPEYFQSSQFTEKSDVYSFGVVLVELLTGEMPISLTRFGENRSLATHFMLAMEEGRVMSIIDAMVIKEGTRDEIFAVANLAMRCLNLNGKNRPTMKEVVAELETIRVAHVPSMVQTNSPQVMQAEELQMMTYGESTSTFMSVEDNFSK
ncbi:hypothetical protein L6452_09775 [Arctium lappa]|uniref:Uncharacterized protein n=1 Tax=Arctium lappa TaxID=4217 RepID=A0ACB9DLJ3_ARCLA|nr:hypothetical protein L6452_09775 [Arctium lappa]